MTDTSLPTPSPIVQVHKVTKSYRRGGQIVPVLEEITFDIAEGEFLALTTLSETELATWRGINVGFIFQFYNLIPVLTAFENVELPLLLTRLTRKERREHVEMALRIVGLADRMDHRPGQLSGGQQQRVAIARAVVTDPTILVADEPTGDLDRVAAEEILHLMDRLNQESGKTVIMVTHDPRAAEKARTIRHLEKGFLNDVSA